jgi:radical SAM superfamily enzyme YgiQ (UPF0313 family)
MSSVTVYFADLTHCGTVTNADTFPYGVGCIAGYSREAFGNDVSVELFKLPHELDAALKAKTPDVLCFSNYVWNHYLGSAFARRVKKAWPHVPIVMGGPNICVTPEGRHRFLQSNPWIDFYIKFEGERGFAGLLGALMDRSLNAASVREGGRVLDNVLYTVGGQYFEGVEQRITDLMAIPSPYLTGLLDKFFDQGLRPLIEFTRGCPYACTFCTDFHPHRNKVAWRTAGVARQEMEYIARHMKASSDMVLADLNFGQYIEDIEIANIIRQTIDRFGWPHSISCSPGKSHPDRVMECVKIINGKDRGVMKFASSVQSTDKTVLSAISRKNLPIDKLRPIMEAANTYDDYTEYFTEIILALPEDSVERHYRSLRDAVDFLGMNIVNVHQLTLLQGSPMALPEQRKQYGLDVRYRVFVGCIGTYRIGDENVPVGEIEEVVIANNTMTFPEWLNCRVMSLLVKIYIDRDYFIEAFGLVRRLGLSAIDVLDTLRTEIIPQYERLHGLIKRFLHKTVEPLHDSLEQATEFAGNPNIVEKFRTGELGGNELLVHRARAYLDHNDDLHDALEDAITLAIERSGKLDQEMREYLKQAICYSKMRKFNPRNFTTDLIGRFSYDFPAAKSKGFQVLPVEIRMHPRTAKFYFANGARSEIDYALRTWVQPKTKLFQSDDEVSKVDIGADGQTMFSFGKLFHNSNLRVLNRSVEFLDEEPQRVT